MYRYLLTIINIDENVSYTCSYGLNKHVFLLGTNFIHLLLIAGLNRLKTSIRVTTFEALILNILTSCGLGCPLTIHHPGSQAITMQFFSELQTALQLLITGKQYYFSEILPAPYHGSRINNNACLTWEIAEESKMVLYEVNRLTRNSETASQYRRQVQGEQLRAKRPKHGSTSFLMLPWQDWT